MIARVRITEAGALQARSKQEGWQGGPYQRATPLFTRLH